MLQTWLNPKLGNLPDNAIQIWSYAFTEMFNNAIDHSGGISVKIGISKNANSVQIFLWDNGVGIFNKIKREMNLLDEREAVLELTKGKLTTDPSRHTGEGIFFTSRMVDEFSILSGGVFLDHRYEREEDWVLDAKKNEDGTFVSLKLQNNTSRLPEAIFRKFSDDNFGFAKTVVPVRLAQYGNEKLVSRSQAKRLLTRVERFKNVIFDFTEVESIGQAFADEVFRVFVRQHPNTNIVPINANDAVVQMIKRAEQGTQEEVIMETTSTYSNITYTKN